MLDIILAVWIGVVAAFTLAQIYFKSWPLSFFTALLAIVLAPAALYTQTMCCSLQGPDYTIYMYDAGLAVLFVMFSIFNGITGVVWLQERKGRL